MIIPRVVHADIFDDSKQYRLTDETEIYQKLDDGYFVAALECVAEQGEDDQYPMEDVLDKYLVHIEAFEVAKPEHPNGKVHVFSSSDVDGIVKLVKDLVGRRAYNVEITEDGQDVVDLRVDDSVAEAKL
ncbi:MAG: hypothetical protein L0G99_05435 [Propionibacteriales bacterium]|nr:hypothetical protein [Propionibacteriales bacterium]